MAGYDTDILLIQRTGVFASTLTCCLALLCLAEFQFLSTLRSPIYVIWTVAAVVAGPLLLYSYPVPPAPSDMKRASILFHEVVGSVATMGLYLFLAANVPDLIGWVILAACMDMGCRWLFAHVMAAEWGRSASSRTVHPFAALVDVYSTNLSLRVIADAGSDMFILSLLLFPHTKSVMPFLAPGLVSKMVFLLAKLVFSVSKILECEQVAKKMS